MENKNIALLYNILKKDKEGYYTDVNSVGKSLGKLGYKVKKVPVSADIKGFISTLKKISPLSVVNLCEEINNDSWGEIYIAGVLELLKIPYTGSGPTGLAYCLNKAREKDILQSHGISVPAYQVFRAEKDPISARLKYPLIIKPLCEDGSYGIDNKSVVYNKNGIHRKINALKKKFGESVIVEEYIVGRELNVSVLGNGKNVTVLPISEINYSNMPVKMPKICSYRAKWDKKSVEYRGTISECPARLYPGLRKMIEETAVKAYDIMECRDYARIDIRLDKKSIIYIIDINPNPCLGRDSGFVRSALELGFTYEGLLQEIINVCLKRYNTDRY